MEKIRSAFPGPPKKTAVFVHRHLGHLLFIFLDLVPAHQFPVHHQKKTVCWAEETQGHP
jgi:hypothetical protein